MKWSLSLGRFLGIEVFVHASFLLILGWFGFIYWQATGEIYGIAAGIAVIVLLFVCVTLHEYGHALTARYFGIGTRHITLLPIGGVAALEAMPEDPREEILVALAGPAVNLAIAAGLYGVAALSEGAGASLRMDLGHVDILATLLSANLALALFNMLPAFPMDGGRVLRAALALRTSRVRATKIAAAVGRALALALGFFGLTGGAPLLVLIAIFVWIGAGGEAQAVATEARLADKPAGRAMITNFHTLPPDAPLSRAVALTLAGSQKDFPVLNGAEVIGTLTQSAILRGLSESGPETPVAHVMGAAHTADLGTPLTELLRRLHEEDTHIVAILHNDVLVGIVNMDNLSEYLRIQAALETG